MTDIVGFSPSRTNTRVCEDQAMTEHHARTIGFLAFDGLQALDLFGPQEVFAEVNQLKPPPHEAYRTVLISADGRPVATQSGVRIEVDCSLLDAPPVHTLLIPGGAGARPHLIGQPVIDWIAAQAPRVSRLGSVCTGLLILARTGLLDGMQVTTHWRNMDEAREHFPHLDFVDDAIFTRSGKLFTAAGITSGIDMALSLVEEDHGADVAAQVARELVVFLRRPGGQRQFSSLLHGQSVADNRFSDLLVWIADNLCEDLSSPALADRVGMSERHFRRVFESIHRETPASAVERIRVETAKQWLISRKMSVGQVASVVGYRSADAFSRAFHRLAGVRPVEFQQRFGCRPLAAVQNGDEQ